MLDAIGRTGNWAADQVTVWSARSQQRSGRVVDEQLAVPDVARKHGVTGMPGLRPNFERRDARLDGAGGSRRAGCDQRNRSGRRCQAYLFDPVGPKAAGLAGSGGRKALPR